MGLVLRRLFCKKQSKKHHEETKNRRVEKAIRTINTRYAIGQEILKQCLTRSRGGHIQLLAKQFGINRDSAQKLRAMADVTRGYTKQELNEWFRRFRRNGYALSISHFQKLLSVPKGKLRNRLTESAVEFRWSSHRLQLEILSCLGRRRAGGEDQKLFQEMHFGENWKEPCGPWTAG